MTQLNPFIPDDSSELADEQIKKALGQEGFALENYFYRSDTIYHRELENILFKSWFYACHVSEIPRNGDFVTIDIGEDSIIIARDKTGKIAASANTCRHRGSRVCSARKGNAKTFVCPYHAWTYEVNGELIGARAMGDDFDKSKYSLKQINAHVFEGLILVKPLPGIPIYKPDYIYI